MGEYSSNQTAFTVVQVQQTAALWSVDNGGLTIIIVENWVKFPVREPLGKK